MEKLIGSWTAQKLEYLDHYLQAYRTVTKNKGPAYYIDLFSACGRCVRKGLGYALDGSPWRALHAVPPFTGYYFVEKDINLLAQLSEDIEKAGIKNASVLPGDCNGKPLNEILAKVPKTALSFAFLDPSGLQLRWITIKRLASHRLGPYKMELLILYPYDMCINRFIGKPNFAKVLTDFYGDESWKEANAESIRLLEDSQVKRTRFIELYKTKLKDLGYKHVDDYGPMGYGDRAYYQVIFAGDNTVGQKIMKDVWSKPRLIPGQFGFEPVKRPSIS